jgi:hypothetical protein
MSQAAMLGLFDVGFGAGGHYAIRTRSVPSFTADVISGLVDAGSARPSSLPGMSIHHFHGASARVPIESTAFGIRRDHLVVEIVAAWEPNNGEAARHRAWADSVWTALAAGALPGGYANLLGPDDHDQIAQAYGQNATRLLAAKTRFDPDGIFSAIPLP